MWQLTGLGKPDIASIFVEDRASLLEVSPPDIVFYLQYSLV